jgi:predicted RNA-binding Zn ribbon-like protein
VLIVQAVLNTVDPKTGADELVQPKDLSDWLARHGLLDAGTKLSRTEVGRAQDVRDGLRALLVAHDGGELDQDAVRVLDEAVRSARLRLRFQGDGSDRFDTADFDLALGHLVTLAAMSRREGHWDKLRICANSECRAVFYEFSHGRAKWCTPRCGNRLRARKYRRTDRYRQKPSHKAPRLPVIFRPLEDSEG